jgi:putative transposase
MLEASWCIKVVEAAIDLYEAQEIINSDQGSQYTSLAWSIFMEKHGIKISMNGKVRATDNACIERLWRTIKNDHLYLNPADTGIELYEQGEYFVNYYSNWYHQGIKIKPINFYVTNSISLNKAS